MCITKPHAILLTPAEPLPLSSIYRKGVSCPVVA
jgi:hypothetical protein